MIRLPLPFFIAFCLVAMAGFVFWRHKDKKLNVPFLVLILIGALLNILVGMRLGLGVKSVGILIPPISAIVPSLAYCGISTLVRHDLKPRIQASAHFIGAFTIIMLMISLPSAVDLAIIALFSGYSFAILLLMWSGSDALYLESFETVGSAYRSIVFAALSLLFYAILDAIVYFEFIFASAESAMWFITIGNISLLIIMAMAAANIGQLETSADAAKPSESFAVEETQQTDEETTYKPEELEKIVSDVENLLLKIGLFRDVGLSLDRLARRLGVPARLVSVAINQRCNRNVSQFVNEFRVSEACTLLRTTSQSVTDIMFSVGFQTKSNFNREFRRVTGMTPLQWRSASESALPTIATRVDSPQDFQSKPLEI